MNTLRIAPDTVDTVSEGADTMDERVRLFKNAILLIVQESDSTEKKEVMAEIDRELEVKHNLGLISDVQKVELLRCLYGQNRVSVYYYDPRKAARKGIRK